MSHALINVDPAGYGDIAKVLDVKPWVVRDAFGDPSAPAPRGTISLTKWWDWRRDVRPFLTGGRFSDQLVRVGGVFGLELTGTPNADPVGFSEIGRRLSVHPNTPLKWADELPAKRGEVRGAGRKSGREEEIKPAPWWDWRRDVEPWGLETGRLIVLGTTSETCPGCKAQVSIRIVGMTPRRRGAASGDAWWSCEECGWTEWETK